LEKYSDYLKAYFKKYYGQVDQLWSKMQ